MKTCPTCSTEAPDDATSCECGYQFANAETVTESHAYTGSQEKRPDGNDVTVISWLCFSISLLIGLVAYFANNDAQQAIAMSSSPYSLDDATDEIAWAALLGNASWLFFYLFLVLWPTGYIVKAISFLPSKYDGKA